MLDNNNTDLTRPMNGTDNGSTLESAGNSVLGTRKEGIKVGAVFANMVIIGFGFMQFGKSLHNCSKKRKMSLSFMAAI